MDFKDLKNVTIPQLVDEYDKMREQVYAESKGIHVISVVFGSDGQMGVSARQSRTDLCGILLSLIKEVGGGIFNADHHKALHGMIVFLASKADVNHEILSTLDRLTKGKGKLTDNDHKVIDEALDTLIDSLKA